MNPIRPLAIGGVTLPNNLLLAPLAGYTDAGFRRAAAVCGAGMTCTEMVSAKALHYGSGKTAELMFTSPEERVKAVQIFGSEPEVMAEAAAGPALAKFDVIDINMGCPMAKITGNGEGSALMKSPDLAGRIVEACVKAAGRPVTVKFRLGLDDANRNYLEFAKVCQSAGASAVTVHGRTTAQLYAGIADRDAIGEVVAALSIPVIANGDITDRPSMLDMFARTGCAGVMIARGALGNPMIFSELLEQRSPLNLYRAIRLHADTMFALHSERFVVLNLRKHLAFYCKSLPNSRKWRARLLTVNSREELYRAVEEAFGGGAECE